MISIRSTPKWRYMANINAMAGFVISAKKLRLKSLSYIAVKRNGTLQLRLLTVCWKSLIQWWKFFLILHLLWKYSLNFNIFIEFKYFAKLIGSLLIHLIQIYQDQEWVLLIDFYYLHEKVLCANPTTYWPTIIFI